MSVQVLKIYKIDKSGDGVLEHYVSVGFISFPSLLKAYSARQDGWHIRKFKLKRLRE